MGLESSSGARKRVGAGAEVKLERTGRAEAALGLLRDAGDGITQAIAMAVTKQTHCGRSRRLIVPATPADS